jgi:homoserine/homoserine lactone efflux protein
MHWQLWAAFALTETVLCLKPGPAVLLVLSQALSRGTTSSLWSNGGILAGNAVYFALSAMGLGALLLASHKAFWAIRWIGAAYLVWMGIAAIAGKSPIPSVAKAGEADVPARRIFLNGLVLQLSSPAALIFFTALLPQFIDPADGIARQVAILAATSITIEFFVLAGYGVLAGRITHLAARPRFATLINRLAGSMLIAAGVGIASLSRV